MKNKESGKNKFPVGSAFILAVVLTTLLAIVGTMFLMAARVNKMSTSAISENRELNFAVETIIAKISQELVLDTPGVAEQEYYDYPGSKDRWLASPEPYEKNGKKWRQISDVTGYINREWNAAAQQDVDVKPSNRTYINEYPEIKVNSDGEFLNIYGNVLSKGMWADADGDGVSDSVWVQVPSMNSSKGKPIFAAIRIVDNCGMINLNTAYKFDEADANMVDGSSQLQINLMALADQPGQAPDTTDETKLLETRVNYDVSDIDPEDLDEYKEDVIWRYNRPEGEYTPFDISDELEMRNRFVLNHPDIITRIEELWDKTFQGGKEVPFDSNMSDWFDMAQYDASGSGDDYSYRHIATTYNMDRIIDPNGNNGDVRKMININEETDVEVLYETLVNSIDTNIDNDDRKEIKKRYAQLAANLADFADDNAEVTVFDPTDADIADTTYYGFEAQPFITEVGMIVDTYPESGRNYFAVEFYNPFKERIHLEDFELLLIDSDGGTVDPERSIKFSNDDWIEAKGCFVIVNTLGRFNIHTSNVKQDPKLRFFGHWIKADPSAPPVDPRPWPDKSEPPVYIGWTKDTTLLLKRKLLNGDEIYVDKQAVDRRWGATSRGRYFERDVRNWHIVYPLEEDSHSTNGSLGSGNGFYGKEFKDRDYDFSFFLPNPIKKEIITVGDIPQILTIGPPEVDSYSNNTIGEQLQRTGKDNEDQIRLDLQNPYHRNIFQYLTVFDPADHGRGNNETRIKGRININTAPWYVIAQLPWVSDELAQTIVAYRDKLKLGAAAGADIDYSGNAGRYYALRKASNTSFNFDDPDDIREEAGFASIGELNFVIGGSNDKYSIQEYALDNKDLDGFPDLTGERPGLGDGIEDDFEERDVIFSRISNLVTVRSDVFTAYILIRIGVDGPQKRVVAILDRSGVNSPDDKVRIVALHYVPDPR
ncbi:hypothetical protein ES703_42860 [subsurface metagenome]